MRLKNLKKETTVAIKNKNEYFFLMDLLEKAGYTWITGDAPTTFNCERTYYSCGGITIIPQINRISRSCFLGKKHLKSVIKFEIGDNVRINHENYDSKNDVVTISGIGRYLGKKIYYIDNYDLHECEKKDIEPFFEDKEKPGEVDWSKVEVDTPILVRHSEDCEWEKRHFAKFENGNVYAWLGGVTSWTAYSNSSITYWKYAKLAGKE